MRARDALRQAAAKLSGDTARLDAELLLAHLLGVERLRLLLDHLDDMIDETAYDALIARRVTGEPIAYITGHREFWSLDLLVTPDVLVPRPDSETLIAAAIAALPADAAPCVLDLGTGSGCLLLAALNQWPKSWGVGIDRSEAALRVARANALHTGIGDRARFLVGSWGEALSGRFDLILCNPPYIGTTEKVAPDVPAFEPVAALFAGPDGLDDYRRIIPQLAALLAPGGSAHLEIGHTQADLVSELARDARLEPSVRLDIEGRARCVSLRSQAG